MSIVNNETIITFDSKNGLVNVETKDESKSYNIGTPEAFSIISSLWIRSGWDNKYVYSFTWLGRPIIQLPEDMFRIQEVIYSVKPDVIIETGIAHGGSLVFYAGLCKMMGKGKVIGVDIDIRTHNKKAITEHELYEYITLVEGSSIDKNIVDYVKSLVKQNDKVLVILDSNHTKEHVLDELKAYSKLVSFNSYIVVQDGIMQNVAGAPRTQSDWKWNNPKCAVEEFIKENNDFVVEEPQFKFNEGSIIERITYWPSAYVKRIK